MADPKTGDWHWKLIRKLGFPKRLFGEIIRPGTVLSESLLPKIVETIGYSCKVTVPCTYDASSLFVALPSKEEDSIIIRADDYASIGMEISEADCSEKSRKYEFTNEAGYQYYKIVMGVGLLKQVQAVLAPDISLAEISSLAVRSKIHSVVDVFDRRFHLTENVAEEIASACREVGEEVPKTVGDYGAVIYRSLARAFSKAVSEVEERTGKRGSCVHVLGMAQEAHYLNQMIAEETQKSVTAGPKDTRAVGNAVVQMMANGVFSDLSEARECIGKSFYIRYFTPHKRESVSEKQVLRSYNTAEMAIRCAKLLSGHKDYDFAMNQVLLEISKVVHPDMLTGVYNRNAMNAKISELNEKQVSVGVLYADVNGLKRVNDELGHIAGDALIKRAAGVLMQVFDRQYVFRAGGDEFVIIMGDVEREAFLEKVTGLEEILKRAKEFSMAVGYRFTETAERLDQTVREADEAMYANKQRYYREHRLKPR